MRKLRIMSVILLAVSLIIFGVFFVRERFLIDRTGPEFKIEDDKITISVKDDETALMNGVTASDARDGDVTDSIIVEDISPFMDNGSRIITYAAMDSDGHVSHAKRTLTYSDYTSPKFHFSQPLRLPRNTGMLPEGITAEDCFDGDVTRNILLLYEGDFNRVNFGELDVTLKVSNSAGDASYLPVTIEIYNPENDRADSQLSLTDYVIYLDQDAAFEPKTYLRPGTIDISRVSIESDVNTHIPGSYSVKYSVTDTEGGTVTDSVRLYVVVTEKGAN